MKSQDNEIQTINYIYIEKDNVKGILGKTEFERINIPNLPDYKWKFNKKVIHEQLYFNSYFIS